MLILIMAYSFSYPFQRAWLLKLLALELHLADMAVSTHRETCLAILSQIFVECSDEIFGCPNGSQTNDADANHAGNRTSNKRKVYPVTLFTFNEMPNALECHIYKLFFVP